MKLPNAKNAFVDIRKLSGYCLNTTHERGKHKARLFSSFLGLTANNAEEVRICLLKAVQNYETKNGNSDGYGKRYIVDFPITTEKGQAMVRSMWIIRSHEDFPRLVSCYVLKAKKGGL